ncbi:LuxR C-terminal-related transcriptional regulator [Nonomuraea gerenzanensis]|nr:LuxR C-terminal-related transcriptional regulator [Nonomuraea gerenzanensis]
MECPPEEVARRVLDCAAVQGPLPAGLGAGPRCSGLTPREREIAVMLTRGLSNRAIATELVISPATVARHIANIMDKLGFDARSQIAVWAAERGTDVQRT